MKNKMIYLGWVTPNECVSFSAWIEWRTHNFKRLLGFEWELPR